MRLKRKTIDGEQNLDVSLLTVSSVGSNLTPHSDNTYDLGTSAKRFREANVVTANTTTVNATTVNATTLVATTANTTTVNATTANATTVNATTLVATNITAPVTGTELLSIGDNTPIDPPNGVITLTGGTTGGLTPGGQYKYRMTYTTAYGETLPSASSTFNNGGSFGLILALNNTNSTSQTTGINLYRTQTGAAQTIYYFLATFPATQNAYTDIISDAAQALTVVVPTASTAYGSVEINGNATFNSGGRIVNIKQTGSAAGTTLNLVTSNQGNVNVTLPNATSQLATLGLVETFTNKTHTAPVLNDPLIYKNGFPVAIPTQTGGTNKFVTELDSQSLALKTLTAPNINDAVFTKNGFALTTPTQTGTATLVTTATVASLIETATSVSVTWTGGGLSSGGTTVYLRKIGTTVRLQVQSVSFTYGGTSPTSSFSSVVGVIPVGYRPSSSQEIPVRVTANGTISNGHLIVDTAGTINVYLNATESLFTGGTAAGFPTYQSGVYFL